MNDRLIYFKCCINNNEYHEAVNAVETAERTAQKGTMPSPPRLPPEMFTVSVTDEVTGAKMETISISRTPPVLLNFAAGRFDMDAGTYFKGSHGLGSVDWRMLFQIARHPGVTAADSSRMMGLDKGTISRCLHRMEKAGLVQAGELHANGRSRGWHLTAEGRATHDAILTLALDRNVDMLAGFTAKEVEQFCNFLLRFLGNLDEMKNAQENG